MKWTGFEFYVYLIMMAYIMSNHLQPHFKTSKFESLHEMPKYIGGDWGKHTKSLAHRIVRLFYILTDV